MRAVTAKRWRTVILASAAVVFVSCLSTTIVLKVFGFDVGSPGWVAGVSMSTLVPLTLSPLIFGYLLRLLALLDETTTHLHEAATVDPLTQVLNRRGFLRAAEEYLASSSSTATLLLADVDNFKLVNDSRGHDFGDTVLVDAARWLVAQSSEGSVVGRLGGDEFVVLTCESGARLAGRLSIHVADYVAEMSVGSAQVAPDGSLSDAMLKADESLYVSKRSRPVAA